MAIQPIPLDIQFTTNKGAQCYIGIRGETGGLYTTLKDYPWFQLSVKQSNGSWLGIAQEDADQFTRTDAAADHHRKTILKKFMQNCNAALLSRGLIDVGTPPVVDGPTDWTDLNSAVTGLLAIFTNHTGLEEGDILNGPMEWVD